MAKHPLYSGVFYCEGCDLEYELDRATEAELVCDKCGGELVEAEEDFEDAEDDFEPRSRR